MPADSGTRSLLQSTVRGFRTSWKSLILTDIAFKVIAFIVLTPLVGVLFRTLIAISGSAVVTDLDILFFFLGPVGWICAVLVGALGLGILALEQASLLGILCAASEDQHLGTVAALRFAAAKAWAVLRVTARVVAWTLLAMAPFLAVAAAVYFTLLTEYDINYYLKEKPPVFWTAVGIGVVLLASMTALLLRLFTGWFFALPLVLFEGVMPREALKQSAARAHGHRRSLLGWIVGWALAMAALSALATGIVGLVGRLLIPASTDSLWLLVVTTGVTMLLWAAANLAVNLLGTTTFATILFNLYRELGRSGAAAPMPMDLVAQRAGDASFPITRGRLLAAGILGIVVSVAVGVFALRSLRLEDDVQIMAHRGDSKTAPENTPAAIRKAIEVGADFVEIDVQETADGEVVVFHDSDFMRQAGVDRKIWDATMDDLKHLDIGSWFAPEFKDERVPTLAEVLRACKGKIRVNIELKYYGHDEQLERRVAEIVQSHEMDADVIAMSLKRDAVRKMKSLRPDWKVGQVMSVSAGDLNELEADFLAVNAHFADRSLIRDAHQSGKEVYVWTVDDARSMSSLMSRGVDGLLTNRPALARSVLEQRAQMSPPERLLLELAGLFGTVPEPGEQ